MIIFKHQEAVIFILQSSYITHMKKQFTKETNHHHHPIIIIFLFFCQEFIYALQD